MENCAAELVIYVPAEGAPDALASLLRETLPECGIPFDGPIERACAEGGTLTLRHEDAPHGSPYGIGPDHLPPGIDADHHVAAHWDWEATIAWIRSGVRTERPSASGWPEPLMSEEDLARFAATGGDRGELESRLRSYFATPAPSYDVGPRRAVVDWDREVTGE